MRSFFLLFIAFLPLLSHAQGGYNRPGAEKLIYKVFFDTSDFHLDERDHVALDKVIEIVNKKPGALFEISGHTDTSGSVAYNYQLGLKRAKTVYNYLLSKGLSKRNFIVISRGESEPFQHMGRYSDKFSRRVEFRQIVRVAGRVRSKSGSPLSARVIFHIPNKPRRNKEVTTGNDGRFEFLALFNSHYKIYISAEGYLTFEDSILVDLKESGSSNRDLDIRLDKAVVKDRLNFDNIYFVQGRAKLMESSKPALDSIAEILKAKPESFCEIRGHVSQPDRERLPEKVIEDGRNLSFARAEAVYRELVGRGINPGRLKFRGMGSTDMLFPNPENEEENMKNRRVEIILLEMR